MDRFEEARQLYAAARKLLNLVADLRATHDRLRWCAEDLEEALLDLKLAVMDEDEVVVREYIAECRDLIRTVVRHSEEL